MGGYLHAWQFTARRASRAWPIKYVLIANDAFHNTFYPVLRAGERGDQICLIGYIGVHRGYYKFFDILIINQSLFVSLS